MASSNFPNITPTTATAKHQSPVGQRNINHFFSRPVLLQKVPAGAGSLHHGFFAANRLGMQLEVAFPTYSTRRSLLMARWELNLLVSLRMVVRAGGRLRLIPTCSSQKTAGSQVIPILKSIPNKIHRAGRGKGKQNKNTASPNQM